MKEKVFLAGLLTLYIALSLTYSLVIPPWETPDEPAHFLYVKHLSEHHRLPSPSPPEPAHFWEHGYVTSLYEWHHPPVYYALSALVLNVLRFLNPTWIPGRFPPINPLFPMHSPVLFLPERAGFLNIGPDEIAIYILRVLSAFLGGFTVLATYSLSKAIFPQNKALAFGAAGFLAFVPQVVFLDGSIRNDTLANTLAALVLLSLVWVLGAPDARREKSTLILAGAALAVGLMTKLTLLFLLPVAALALLMRIRLAHSRQSFWLPCLWFLAPFLVILGLFYLLLPDLWRGTQHILVSDILVGQMPWASWERFFPLLTRSFWGRFGWFSVPLPDLLCDSLTVIVLLGLGGALALWAIGLRSRRLTGFQNGAVLLLFSAVLLLLASVIRFNLSYWQPQGRFLFPALPALAVLVSWGLLGAARERFQRVRVLLVVGGLFLINLWSLVGLLFPTYYLSPLVSTFQGHSNSPVGEIWGPTTHGQSFTCRYPNLVRIDVLLATYARENHHPLVFHLRESPFQASDLVTITVPAEAITDNAYYSFSFEPLPDSAGRTYYFYLEAPEAQPGDAFTIWADLQDDSYPLGTRYVNHDSTSGDLRFVAFSIQPLPGSKP